MFKSFILTFKQKEPQVHKLHDVLANTTVTFFACFIKVENLNDRKLVDLDLSLSSHQLPLSQLYTDSKVTNLLQAMFDDEKKAILTSLKKAYIKTGEYMRKKLPLNNKFLENLSALDPIVRGHSAAVTALDKLRAFFPTLDTDQDSHQAEVKKYHLAENLPSPTDIRLDHWWAKVMPNYPALSPIIKAFLQFLLDPEWKKIILHDESHHNNQVKYCRMAVSTYEAYQAIKYQLLTRNISAVQLFKRNDILYDQVDKSLVLHIQTAKQRGMKCTSAHRPT
ncbi:hypothetical protein RRG08_015502 [Elysia crispata]|uniref:HAT C-terminal dimerisation domain-containing protein n=1 Tax=Elysia crispata TaxID=231223 RepID=A0AAE1ADI1_9GAST|nr:hypothetical protein RRG08_015502 [Elysia crispata]